MKNKPWFSIIIPTYNSVATLGRALLSVDSQTFRDFEVLVCDDGSTDNTEKVARDFSGRFDIEFIRDVHWGGPARPRNNGLRRAQGEYIAFLDSDDWWYPDKLQRVERYTGGADVIYHDLDIYTPKGQALFRKVRGRRLNEPAFTDLMRNENALITSSVVARKSVIDEVGGLEEDRSIVSLEDFDLWLKLARRTEKFFYIPLSLGAYWAGEGSISMASAEKIKRLNIIYGRYLGLLSSEDREQAETIMYYLLARTNQKIGLYKEALDLFTMSANSENAKIRFRSICWIAILNAAFFLKSTGGSR